MIAAVSRYIDELPLSLKVLLAAGVYVLIVLASLAAVAVVVVRLPETYFLVDEKLSPADAPSSVARWAGLFIRNLAGVVLVLVGLLLSLPGIPGQGVLTVLIGVMLLSFPGKRRLERRLISRPSILAAVNALRARFGKRALRLK